MTTYYAEYNGLTVGEYVQKYIYSSEEEMSRMRRTVEAVPAEVESLLDVGAGHGVFLELLEQERGIKGVGIEVTEAKVEYGRAKGLDMRLGDASRLQFPDKSFDAIVSSEVIEHLPFGVYEAALSELTRVARKYVLISVPYNENRVFVECPYCGARSNPSFHMRSFDREKLAHLFPTATLDETWTLGTRRTFPLIDILGRPFIKRSWPKFSVCPACGYRVAACRDMPSAHAALERRAGKSAARRLVRASLSLLSVSKPRWFLARYRVDNASGSR